MLLDYILLSILLGIVIYSHFILTYELLSDKGYKKIIAIVLGFILIIGLIIGLIVKPLNCLDGKQNVNKKTFMKINKNFVKKKLILFVKIFVSYLLALIVIYTNVKLLPNKLIVIIDCVILAAIIFVHSSICSQIYDKKGLGATKGAFIGLLPIVGMYMALKNEGKRNVQPGTIKKAYNFNSIALKLVIFVELCGLALIVVAPVAYMVGASFSTTNELPTSFWPSELTIDNYKELFVDYNFGSWYKNTLIIAILNMIIGVICITGAGYVFARFKFKGKKFGLIAILVLQVFPSFMGMIAMYTLFSTFGLLGQPIALTILYVGGSIPFNLWLIKGYLSQIPKDLDESAMLDGANKLQIFFKIILPLSVPILSFVAVNQFMAPWMDYMLPSLLLKEKSAYTSSLIASGNYTPAEQNELISQQYTLAVGLFEMISGQDKNAFTTFAAGALIVALPITVLYMIFQKFLIEGITAGATKG